MTDDLVERLRTKSAIINMGEKIAWGSETALMTEAADTILKLQAEVAEARALNNKYAWERDKAREERDAAERKSEAFWKPRLEAAEAEVAWMRTALEPFAKLADRIERDYPDYADHILIFFELTHGDFRRARSALQGERT